MAFFFFFFFGISLVALVLLSILSYYFLIRVGTIATKSCKTAPEASGGWPILGHLPLLGRSQTPRAVLGAMADEYGPIFTIRLGLMSTVVVSSWEMAKECFSTNDLAVSSRPRLVGMKHMGYNHAIFGFAEYGPFWREMRKLVTLQLLSNHRVDRLKDSRNYEVRTSVRRLYKLWTAEKEGLDGRILIHLDKWFGEVAYNVIIKAVAGKRYFCATTAEEEGKARRRQKALNDFMHLMGKFVVSDCIPFLGWLDIGGYEKEMKKIAKELDQILEEWLEEHKRKRDSGEAKGDEDFIYVMLSTLDGQNVAGFDADTVIKATCLAMILGGSDTSTVTLTWAMSLLLNNPETLKMAQEELDVQVGRGRLVDESDIGTLVYIQAIIKETFRLYPPAPLSGPRVVTEDCSIGGYHVRKGTRLITNLWKIQTDPRIWEDPLDFKPERFLTSCKDIDVRGKHYGLIPFGSGRRICPGISFSLQAVSLTLALFLQAFDVMNPSNDPIDMSENFGLTNAKATPLQVVITPRLSSHLYD